MDHSLRFAEQAPWELAAAEERHAELRLIASCLLLLEGLKPAPGVVPREVLPYWVPEVGSLVLPQLAIVLSSRQRSNPVRGPSEHLCVEQRRQYQCHSLLHTLHSPLQCRHLLGEVWLALAFVYPLLTVY